MEAYCMLGWDDTIDALSYDQNYAEQVVLILAWGLGDGGSSVSLAVSSVTWRITTFLMS